MATAYKCDQCGKLYEPYEQTMSVAPKEPTPGPDSKPVHAVKISLMDGKKKQDVCPECTAWWANKYSEYLNKISKRKQQCCSPYEE
jgi:DNA-directed RNA polymerase subunit RPC12/RpoP